MSWFVKSRRAANVDDYETWNEGGVTPTLNAFDNATETRATVLVVYPLDTRNATRDPDKRDAVNRQGLGVGNAGDPSPTLTNVFVPGVAITEGQDMDEQKAALVRMRAGKEGGGKGALVSEERSLTLATSNDQTPFASASTVRRLTPVECERLQGFPDNWTDGQADSHRYKQMGNAVTVNVAEVVGRFIMEAVADNA